MCVCVCVCFRNPLPVGDPHPHTQCRTHPGRTRYNQSTQPPRWGCHPTVKVWWVVGLHTVPHTHTHTLGGGYCLLHQKLQLLNAAVQQKRIQIGQINASHIKTGDTCARAHCVRAHAVSPSLQEGLVSPSQYTEPVVHIHPPLTTAHSHQHIVTCVN